MTREAAKIAAEAEGARCGANPAGRFWHDNPYDRSIHPALAAAWEAGFTAARG